jgi:hypothetical protein
MHGGKSLAGVAHPRYRTGLHSKHTPANLRRLYRKGIKDPELLSLRDDLAFHQALQMEALERMQTGLSDRFIANLAKLWARLRAANAAGDLARQEALLRELDRLVRQGADYKAARDEYREITLEKAGLAAREWHRQADLQQTMTAERVMALVTALAEVVNRRVPDAATRLLISEDFERLVGPE